MSKSNIIIGVLVALVVAMLFKIWFIGDADDRAKAESYRKQVEQQQAIISDNNKQIEYLKYKNLELDLKNDSLIDLKSQSIERVRIIYKDNEQAHSNIDTTGVSDIYIYWATELERYNTDLRCTRRAVEDEDQ